MKTAATMCKVIESTATSSTTSKSRIRNGRWLPEIILTRLRSCIDHGSKCWMAITMMPADKTARGKRVTIGNRTVNASRSLPTQREKEAPTREMSRG
jgi:hypothetical protein